MTGWLGRHRTAVGVAALVIVTLAGGGYVLWTAANRPTDQVVATGPASIGGLLFIDQRGGANTVVRRDASGATTATGLHCQRVYSAGGTTVCLRLAGIGPRYEAAVFDAAGAEVRVVPLPGVPSRARVSDDGTLVTWTVFVTGDSYLAPGGFATRVGVLDLRDGSLTESLEHYRLYVDDVPYQHSDLNYWGVTAADDGRTFYATAASGGRTWLVRGDLVAHTVHAVRENAECPSLSPDGTRVVYKKRAGRLGAWQLHVLDLASGVETPLPGTSPVDDQAAWLDNDTIAYAMGPGGGVPPTIHTSRADGGGTPMVLVAEASSPTPVSP